MKKEVKKIKGFSEEQVKGTMEQGIDKDIDTARKCAVNDVAVDLMRKDKSLTLDKATEMAEKIVPTDAMAEMLRNYRISANYCGTMFAFLENLRLETQRVGDLLEIIFEDKIKEYVEREAKKMKIKK